MVCVVWNSYVLIKKIVAPSDLVKIEHIVQAMTSIQASR
jgi:hypothetical protein